MTVRHTDPTPAPVLIFLIELISQINIVVRAQSVVLEWASVFEDLLPSIVRWLWSDPPIGCGPLFVCICMYVLCLCVYVCVPCEGCYKCTLLLCVRLFSSSKYVFV